MLYVWLFLLLILWLWLKFISIESYSSKFLNWSLILYLFWPICSLTIWFCFFNFNSSWWNSIFLCLAESTTDASDSIIEASFLKLISSFWFVDIFDYFLWIIVFFLELLFDTALDPIGDGSLRLIKFWEDILG